MIFCYCCIWKGQGTFTCTLQAYMLSARCRCLLFMLLYNFLFSRLIWQILMCSFNCFLINAIQQRQNWHAQWRINSLMVLRLLQILGLSRMSRLESKMSHHYLVKCTTFSSDWRYVRFFKRWWIWNEPFVGWHWWLWKELVVMCGKWNVRQATLQQVFKVTTFCTDTCFQSLLPLINCIIHHFVLKFSPCRNKTLLFRNSSI